MAEAGLKWVTLFDNQEAEADKGAKPKKPRAPKQPKAKPGASLFHGPGMTADSELHDLTVENENEEGAKGDAKGGGNKRLSVERIYQKKSQLEHILLRPDTYIGSVETVTQNMWVYDDMTETMVQRELTFVPGLYKIFDEIVVNAADNKQRDPSMNCIKIDIDAEKNQIKVWNNGKGIPVVEHKTEKMYVPTLIFGHLLTSSNYDDSEKKVTGGRNGYGAKLCNIFSTRFVVETSSHEYRKSFKQTWVQNMGMTREPSIGEARSEDFTCITFQPDLEKFKMTQLDPDTVALFTRRAYDIAATTKGVKVFLNGKRLPVKSMKDYIELFVKGKEDEAGQPLKVVHETPHERWDVAVTLSDKGFQQVSFVNSIATTKGGRHVDYCVDHIVSKLIEVVKKKNKGGINIKPFQIKNHLWIFVNCLIENPTFDSQTKETMTLQAKSFGSRPVFSEKFVTQVSKCGVVESILSWMKFKAQAQLNKKCHASKHSKLKGIPKLDDANDAGTRNSRECTLILTEGDSAKSLAVAGLGVIGRDRYGVFPLRGKVLNVREATHKQIMDNAEINNVIKIMGLQFKEKYDTPEALKSLRYGKLMIMTDQDQDGSHIKGLIINFIHHFWPNLLKHNVIEEFITPIVKVAKGKQELAFYSLPEFEEWKGRTDNWHTWKVKYYKGLGTSTSKEAKEYFTDMERHRIPFKYAGADDDASIHLAFSKKKCEERKEWLTNWMQERKRRAEMGLPELFLYGKNTTSISYNEFINRELILFSNMDLVRSIPSLVDGFKPGQRKVMFTCFKRNLVKEMKVAQLAGSVAEHSAYHHGEQALMGTIIGLAQNFTGSNNLNLLVPCGQFGTRIHGGKDAASPRYIFTHLSPLARMVYNVHDDPLLEPQFDDNLRIEPYWYCPILPMVLVNGAEGIGTGWSTKIPNYDIREIVANLKRMLDGLEPRPMRPCFKDYRGTIEEVGDNRYVVSGEISIIDDTTVEISELPIRVWTQNYKEEVLEPMLHGTDKVPSIIQDYKEYHTDTTVKFTVKMSSEQLAQAEEKGLHKVFKIQTTLSTSSMVLFDHNGVIKRYSQVEEILREFFDLRLDYYQRRKDYLDGMLSAESLKLDNIARFILEKIDGTIVIENKPKKELVQLLVRRGYESDPVKAWKESQSKGKDDADEEEDGDGDSDASGSSGPDFNYILNMALWCLTKERKDELLKQRDGKRTELATLRQKTHKDLWKEDLEEFLAKLDEVEAKEREDAVVQVAGGKGGKGGKVKPRKVHINETKPSPMGRRVEPRIDSAMKMKFQKDADRKRKIKEKKGANLGGGDEDGVVDDEDGMEVKPLAQRLKFENKEEAKPKVKRPRAPKGTAKSPAKGKKGGKKRNPWSDSESDVDAISDVSDLDNGDEAMPVIPRDTAPRRAAAAKVSYKFDDEEESDVELVSDEGSFKPITSDKEDDYSATVIPDSPPPKPKVSAPPTKPIITANFSDDSDDSFHMEIESNSHPISTQSSMGPGGDSDNDLFNPKPVVAAPAAAKASKPPAQKKPRAKKVDPSQPSVFSAFAKAETMKKRESKAKPAAQKPQLKKRTNPMVIISDEEEDGEEVMVLEAFPEKTENDKPKKPRKKKADDGSDSERPKKKAKKFTADFSDDGMSDDEFVPKKKKAAPKKKKKADSDDEDGLDLENIAVAPRSRPGRAKAAVKYTFDDDDDDDDDDF